MYLITSDGLIVDKGFLTAYDARETIASLKVTSATNAKEYRNKAAQLLQDAGDAEDFADSLTVVEVPDK